MRSGFFFSTLISLLLLLSLGLPHPAGAHGLDCNLEPITFVDAVNHNFIVSEPVGASAWSDLEDCVEPNNLVSGDGGAACVSETSTAVESILESSDFYLGCKKNATLHFRAFFRTPNQSATLSFQVLPDGANNWLELQPDWTTSHEGGGFGEDVSLPLEQYAGNGFAPTRVRWVFKSTGSPDQSFAQLDNISITCTDGPRTDIDLSLIADLDLIPQGAIRPLSIKVLNLGPLATSNISLVADISELARFLPLPNSSGNETISPQHISASLGAFSQGSEQTRVFDVQFGSLHQVSGAASLSHPRNSAHITAAIQSPVCDVRLNNNSRERQFFLDDDRRLSDLFSRDMLRLSKLTRQLRALSLCRKKQQPSMLLKLLQKISNSRAKQRLHVMIPHRADELLRHLRTLRKNARAIRSSDSCQSRKIRKAHKASKKFKDRLTQLFLSE